MSFNPQDPFADIESTSNDPFADIPTNKGGVSAAFGAGIDKMQELGYRALKGFTEVGADPNDFEEGTINRSVAGLMGQGGTLAKFADEGINRNIAEQSEYEPTVASYKDVDSIGSAASYVGELTANSIPYMAATLNPVSAFALGGGLSNEAYEAQEEKDPLRAVLSGYGQMGLERLGTLGSIGKLANGPGRVKNTLMGAAGEGTTEVGQDAIAQWGAGTDFSDIDTSNFDEAFVGGAAVGGTLRGGTESINALRDKIAPTEQITPTDSLESVLSEQNNEVLFNPQAQPVMPSYGLMDINASPIDSILSGEQNPAQQVINNETFTFNGDVESPIQQVVGNETFDYNPEISVTPNQETTNSSVVIAKSGKPFKSEKSMQISKDYKDAVAAGLNVETVEVDGGYGWQVAQDVEPTQEIEQPVTQEITQSDIIETERQPDPVEQNEFQGLPIQETPLNELTLSEDVPQFKDGANDDGVVDALGGSFDRTGVAPIQVWVREDGRKEVISGRHRLDLARRSGEETIPTQYHYESDGFNTDNATALDAILNVRDGQGKVKDYVKYLQANQFTQEEAKSQGILGRSTGRRAFTIANNGSDDLIAAHSADLITDEAATRLAEVAPNEAKYQALGLKAIQEGKSIANAENLVRAVKSMTGEQMGAESGDLFGFDDSAMVEAEKLAKAASAKQRELKTRLSAIRGAAKNPKVAKAEGVDVKDPNSLNKRITELTDQAKAWESWHTNPSLANELREAAGIASSNDQTTVKQSENLEAQSAPVEVDENQNDMFGAVQDEKQVETQADLSTETVDKSVDNTQDTQSFIDSKKKELENYQEKVASGFWKEEAVKPLMNKLGEQIAGLESELAESQAEITPATPTKDRPLYRGQPKGSKLKLNDKGLLWLTPDKEYASDPHYGGKAGSEVVEVDAKETSLNLFDHKNADHAKVLRDKKSVIFRSAANGDFRALQDENVQEAIKGAGFDGFYAIEPEGQESIALFDAPQDTTNPEANQKPKRKTFGWDAVKLADNYTAKELDEWSKELSSDPDNKNKNGSVELFNKETQRKLDKLSWAVTYHIQNGTETNQTTQADDKAKVQKEINDAGKVSLSSVIEESNSKDLTEADKLPSQKPEATLSSHKEFTKRIDNADESLTANDVLEAFKIMREGVDAIEAELNTLTKDKILKYYRGYHSSGMKKADLARHAANDLITGFGFVTTDSGSMIMVGSGRDARFDGIQKKLESLTTEQLQKNIQAVKAEKQKRVDEYKAKLDGAANPETLDDFRNAVRLGRSDDFTPEQWAKYDRLHADDKLETQAKEAIKTVEAIQDDVSFTTHETVHSKKDIPLFVVSLDGRVEKELYTELNTRAKSLGGYYSSYNKAGAIPGFQFKSEEDRKNFLTILDGKAVDKVKEDKDKTESLEALADRIEERATGVINQDRKTNTARRSSMAAGAIGNAEAELSKAAELRSIAEAIKSGEAKYLAKLATGTERDLIASLWNRLRYDVKGDAREELLEQEIISGNARGMKWKKGVTPEQKVRFAQYPLTTMRAENVKRVANEMIGTKGYKQAALKFLSDIKNMDSDKQVNVANHKYRDKFMQFIRENESNTYFEEIVKDYSRLRRMGITTTPMLRAALLEYDAITSNTTTKKVTNATTEKLKYSSLQGKYKENDFFNSPARVVEEVISYAEIEPGMKVLEPSAGAGHLADGAADIVGKENVQTMEFAYGLQEFLKDKGYAVNGGDFLAQEPEAIYDRIVMNPPFSKEQEITHVEHAYKFLKPGGRLVSVTGSMAGNRSNKQNAAFSEWLDELGAEQYDLPDGSFKDAINPTNVNTKVIIIDKPLTDGVRFNKSKQPLTTRGVTEKSAKLAFKRFTQKFKGLNDAGFDQIITDKKPSDIFGPSVAADDNNIKGAYDKSTNRLYIFSANHKSIEDIRRTLREELLTHKGLGVFEGKEISELLDRIDATRDSSNKAIQDIWADIEKNYGDQPAIIQAEEFLGKVSQDGITVPGKYWHKIVATLQKLMRKFGLVKDTITVSEMRTVVAEIASKLKAGKQVNTITVNGKVRSTLDNLNQPIHNTTEGIKKFWEWQDAENGNEAPGRLGARNGSGKSQKPTRESGSDIQSNGFYFSGKWGTPKDSRTILELRDSAVKGRTVRYYHGTRSDIDKFDLDSPFKKDNGWLGKGVYVTPFYQLADAYSRNRKGDLGGNIMPVYIKVNNPIMADFSLKRELRTKSKEYVEKWTQDKIKLGYDSVMMADSDYISEVVVFSPTQVKSAIGNNGEFSNDNSDIRFNRDTDNDAPFTLPEETRAERAIRFVQDKLNRVKKAQKVIGDAGINVSENADVYGKEALYYGKVEEDFRQLAESYIEPIAEKLASEKITQQEFDLYLYALHAKERNEHINSMDEEMLDGSGMTDQEADAIIAAVQADPRREAFQELNTQVRTMIDERIDKMRDHGLIDEETFDSYQNSYQHYVPLKGQAKDEGGKPKGTGMGFSIKGKESIAALGRKSKAESPLLHAFTDTQKAIVRGHKNEVSNAMLSLIQEAPNPELWNSYTTEGPLERKKGSDGKIIMAPMSKEKMAALASNPTSEWVVTKKHGIEHYMKFEDELIAHQMKSVGVDNGNKITQMLGSVNRFLSMMSTSANPEFLITNMVRDVQTAVFNVAAESEIKDGKINGLDAKAFAKSAFKGLPKAFAGIRKALRDNDTSSEWGSVFADFRKQGAKTGYFDMKDIETQENDLKKMMLMQDKKSLVKFKDKAFKFIEDYNSSVENAIRLSVYKTALDNGVSKHTAAVLAKNLTVNFNRKGEAGTWLNSLYLFANAGIQGTANFARAIGTFKIDEDGNKKLNLAQKAGIAMAGVAFGMASMNRMIADDDEDGENFWDKIPDHVKERNIVLMIGGKDYITVPLPYGYNIFANFGTAAESVLNGGKILDNAGFLAKATMGSFLPLGLSEGNDGLETTIKTVMPQIGKPLIDLSTNTNFFGSRIYNDNNEIFGDKRSDAASGYDKTNAFFKSTAMGLNKLTGGTEYQSGVVDIHPETIRYLAEYIGGGAGRFALQSTETVARASKGEFDATRTPFVRRGYGEVKDYSDQSAFYDHLDEVETIQAEFKSLRGPERLEFRNEYKDILKLSGIAKSTKSFLSDMRKRKKKYEERGMTEEVEKLDALMETRIDRFNKRYNEAMEKR